MKAKTLLSLVGLLCLLWSARGAGQTSIVPWSASGMGYKVSSSSTTIVKCLVGQAFVGMMQGANSVIEAGFLVDTLFRTTVTSVTGPPEVPKEYALSQNYPNPFNPTTTIQFTIANPQLTIVRVFDLLGREVATLVNEIREPGVYAVGFDGSYLPSGVYFYRLQAGVFTQTKRLLLLK
jgi:hypothetical protein